MAGKSKPKPLNVYLYIPNIIGYLRILMNCVAFAVCFVDKKLFSLLYFVSFVCDALDGWFARKFNQGLALPACWLFFHRFIGLV
uniref:Phosphatidylinositol synthase n=1 Tax=Solanum tuberosum TaxID=4113 RepID=M1B6Y0_SOLTU